MSISKTSVVNSALGKIGAERVSSITQDCKRAIILNSVYDEVRDSLLRSHPWNFATKRVALTPVAATPAWGYGFQYDSPNDCLKVITTDPDDIDFVIENGMILSNEETLNVLYVFRQDDESQWDSCFAEAMSWRLAAEVCYNLTQSATLAKMCDDKCKSVLAEARSMDGAEGVLKGLESDAWVLSRRS